MKKVLFVIFCTILITGMASTSSCKKDHKIRGCTDKSSQNYDASAQEDDGSCTYAGSVVFWYDQATSQGLTGDGATALTFYLNNEIVGSTATSVYWASAPDCGANGTVTVNEDLGKVKTLAYSLSVKDQTGYEYWTATVNVEAKTCLQFQLLWSSKK